MNGRPKCRAGRAELPIETRAGKMNGRGFVGLERRGRHAVLADGGMNELCRRDRATPFATPRGCLE